MHVLILTYALNGADRVQHAELCEELAPAFAVVPGLVSQTWLANDSTGRYGAVYVFAGKSAFDAFVASELYALVCDHRIVKDVSVTEFGINPRPTAITRGPVQIAL